MKISNELYDILKWVCTILIPSLITLLGVVLPLLGVSAETTNAIVTIIGALGVFVGSLIGISSINYKKGENE